MGWPSCDLYLGGLWCYSSYTVNEQKQFRWPLVKIVNSSVRDWFEHSSITPEPV